MENFSNFPFIILLLYYFATQSMISNKELSNELKLEQPSLQSVGKSPTVKALVSLFIALVALSFAAIFIRLSELEIGSNATIFNRLWIATLFFGLWNSIKKIQAEESKNLSSSAFNLNRRYFSFFRDTAHQPTIGYNSPTQQDLGLLILMGVASSISIILWSWSLTQTSVANSTVLRNLTPVFTTLWGWLLLKQSFDIQFLAGMAIAFVGAVAIGISDFSVSIEQIIGDGAALLAAMLYSIYLLSIEQLRSRFSTATILLWRCALGTVITLPIALLKDPQIFPHTLSGWMAVISLALICQVLGQGLLAQSLNQLSSGFVATTLLLEPAISAFIAWLLFSEKLTLLNWIAFFVVLAGVYLAKPRQLVVTIPEKDD
jgi:drug/metabolite transporter (DMT)-like permease